MPQNTVSIQLGKEKIKDLKKFLIESDWFPMVLNNQYVDFAMKSKSGVICTVYTSGKVVLQGNSDFSDVMKFLDKEDTIDSHIGVDEVGKGDYFGPLVVVGCFVDSNIAKKAKELGVGDSKKFTDKKIMEMYKELKTFCLYYSSVVTPLEYAKLVKDTHNVAILLARQHSKVIEMGLTDLKKKKIECRKVVIDQFSNSKSRVINELGVLGKSIELVQFHKGESDVAVACASIIARGIFIEEFNKMCEKYDFDFPKGASDVINSGRKFVAEYGEKELKNVAKISFRTTESIL